MSGTTTEDSSGTYGEDDLVEDLLEVEVRGTQLEVVAVLLEDGQHQLAQNLVSTVLNSYF